MDVDGTITLMLTEVEQNIMDILANSPHKRKWKEFLQLEEQLLKQYDSPELRRFLDLELKIREIERHVAQFTGITVGLRLNQIVGGQDVDTLLNYCADELDFED